MFAKIVVYTVIILLILFLFKNKFHKVSKCFKYNLKFVLIYIATLTSSIIFMPLLIWKGRNVKNGRILVSISTILSKLIGITWQIRNVKVLSEKKGAVIVLNHQSSFDILVACELWNNWNDLSLVVKKELFFFLPFGISMYLADTIFVDRGNPKLANQLLIKRSNELFQKKVKLVIFPEGTRNNDSTKLLPFKKGAFNIAVAAQVPIIPIVVSPYYFINKQKYIFDKGHVILQLLEPVPTEGLTMDDVPDLLNKVQNSMEKVLKELSEEVTKEFTT